MPMTRQDFERIALAIRQARRIVHYTPSVGVADPVDHAVDIVVTCLTRALQENNPAFNVDVFLKATIEPTKGAPDYTPPFPTSSVNGVPLPNKEKRK